MNDLFERETKNVTTNSNGINRDYDFATADLVSEHQNMKNKENKERKLKNTSDKSKGEYGKLRLSRVSDGNKRANNTGNGVNLKRVRNFNDIDFEDY